MQSRFSYASGQRNLVVAMPSGVEVIAHVPMVHRRDYFPGEEALGEVLGEAPSEDSFEDYYYLELTRAEFLALGGKLLEDFDTD